jgi:hypothetical protein
MKNSYINQIGDLKVSIDKDLIRIDLPIFRHDFWHRYLSIYMIGFLIFIFYILSQIINLADAFSWIFGLVIFIITYLSIRRMIWILGQNKVYINQSHMTIISNLWIIRIKKRIKISNIKSVYLKEMSSVEIAPKHYYVGLKKTVLQVIKFGFWLDKENGDKVVELIKSKTNAQQCI